MTGERAGVAGPALSAAHAVQCPAPLVSVVIAAYNSEATIGAAIASVREQTEQAIEIIVVDDCSQDGTVAEVLRSVAEDRRVTLVQLSRNQGPGAARNAAIDVATAEWIALLDADDTFQPHRLERLRKLGTQNDADMVSDDVLLCEDGQPVVTVLPPHLWPEPRQMDVLEFLSGNKGARGQRRILYGFMKPMFRRNFLIRNGLRFPPLYFAEDYILYLKCLISDARWLVVPEPMYNYRVRGNSLTANFTPEQLASVAAADGEVLNLPAVTANSPLYRAIRQHKLEVERAVSWMQFVFAVRRGDLRCAVSAALSSRQALRHVTSQTLRAIPRTCARVATRGQI
jgi:glycosyltransferase involved in cell wall biosynthesis